jgi:transposase InsO family protein
LPLGGEAPADEDDRATLIARGLLQRQPAPELAFTFTTLAAAAVDAQDQALAQVTGGADAGGGADVWEDAEVMALLRAGAVGAGGAGAGGAEASRRAARRAVGYRWDAGQLLRCMPDGRTCVCPPPDQRLALTRTVHERTGHLGVRRTLALLQTGHWWFSMRQTVQQVLRSCRACDMSNARGEALPSRLNPLPVRGLFYRLGVDLAGPLPPSEPDKNRYVMVVVEHFSKHVELIPLPEKTAARTARALAGVFARFGAPAEVLTDNGTEFQGEFAALLESCFVDHRLTSPGHPQADGAAERVVQVLKEVLRKTVYLTADPNAWEQALPELLLGYRCSPQQSTRYSPYELLYGGIKPVIPPAIRERLQEPLDLDDVQLAAESLVLRAAWVRQAYPAAAGNLLIAQHRDTLRYAAIRTGRYLAKPITYAPGDYVYVRRVDADQRPTLQFGQHDTILRVESVGPLGVAVLVGRDGARVRRRAEHLRPCHLDIDPAVEPQLFRPQRDLQCEVCGSPHQAAKMLLCDGCNTGWHTHCLRLAGVPPGQWLCPRCKELDTNEEVLNAGPGAAEAGGGAAQAAPAAGPVGTATDETGAGAAAAAPGARQEAAGPSGAAGRRRRRAAPPAAADNEELGRLLFPRGRTQRRDDQAAELGGRRVRKAAAGPEGVLEYLGALARPRYFRVLWSDGVEQQLTLAEARRHLVD